MKLDTFRSPILWSGGGFGDILLSFRLGELLKQKHNIRCSYVCCCRDETWKMIETVFWDKLNEISREKEHYLDYLRDNNELKDLPEGNFAVYPDKIFRGLKAFPLQKYNTTNFSIKQTRTLLSEWRPEGGYISIALNSITPFYTYHSIPQLLRALSEKFPDKKIYCPVLTKWNDKELTANNFSNLPDNVKIDINPAFRTVYSILCQSEYAICSDNGIMHICHDLGMPYLTLDPQFDREPFQARWRAYGNYHSIPISALVEDIVNVVKTHIEIPETQMIPVENIFRKDNIDYSKLLIFKE